jgi:VanZ family protein
VPINQSAYATLTGRYLPLVIWLALIFFASSDEFSASNTSRIIGPLVLWLFPNTSPQTLETIHFLTRKVAHFSEYFVLGFLAARAFHGTANRTLNRHAFSIAALLIVVYALTDEYHQTWVPSRTSSIFDSMIDIAGGLTALTVFHRRSLRKYFGFGRLGV